MAPVDQAYVPVISNVRDGEDVYHRLLTVIGTAGPFVRSDATIRVDTVENVFPPQMWQATDGHFKALVPLSPGPNTLIFTYIPSPCPIPTPPLSPLDKDTLEHSPSTKLHVNYDPVPSKRPLHLAILVAKDSTFTVDCPPEKRGVDDGFDTVKRKFALQVYMWQSFTAEDMHRHGLGRRTFRLDEHSQPKTVVSLADLPKIHVLRSSRTMKELREKDNAQQYKGAKHGGAMLDFALDVLRSRDCPPELRDGQGAHVACLTLDTQWDPSVRLIRAHAAVGFGGPGMGHKVGVMGSHWIHSAPISLEEVTARFLDTTPTDEKYCVNDLDECGTNWETLNIGSGAFMHETGHVLNNPHHPSGIMARGYQEFNRAFMTREEHSSRTRSRGFRPITPQNDAAHNHWHRLAAMRFRYHPLFQLTTDPVLPALLSDGAFSNGTHGHTTYLENEPIWQPVEGGLVLNCPAGVGSVEIEVDGKHATHLEWPFMPGSTGQNAAPPPSMLTFSVEYLRTLLRIDVMQHRVTLNAVATNHRQAEVKDFKEAVQVMQVQGLSGSVMKTVSHGQEADDPRRRWMAPFHTSRVDGPYPAIISISIHAGAFLDGFMFEYADGTKQAFGNPSGGSPTKLKVQKGEHISKIVVRSGAWLDAAQIILDSGRSSPMCGGNGGGVRVVEAPAGHTLVGLYGSGTDAGGGRLGWMTSLGGLYQRIA